MSVSASEGGSERVLVIAEAGVNHNGDLDLARQLIDVAAEAGADAVKFQSFKAHNLVGRSAPKAAYQRAATGAGESQLAMLQRLELSEPTHRQLMEHCQRREIRFLSTPFDADSLALLDRLGLDTFKVASGEVTSLPLLRAIGELCSQGKQVILSTGMCTLAEIESALVVLERAGTPRARVTVRHANTEYPTPMSDVNLRAMSTIARELGVKVGYSDHTLGIEVPIAAVALGAVVIEKHFTLDRSMSGPDHQASLEPDELRAMVSTIRNIEAAMGTGIKAPSPSESRNLAVARKSIVARTTIRQGETFSEANLTIKRPGTGISPMRWDELIGRQAPHDYQEDELIWL